MPDAHLDALSIDRRAALWDQILAAAPARGQRIWISGAEEIDGFICVGPSRDSDVDPAVVGELQAIYLLPSMWGRGVGRALHQIGIDWLRAQGKSEATLWVVEGNVRATAFYKRQGWRADGSRKHEVWDETPMNELRLRLVL